MSYLAKSIHNLLVAASNGQMQGRSRDVPGQHIDLVVVRLVQRLLRDAALAFFLLLLDLDERASRDGNNVGFCLVTINDLNVGVFSRIFFVVILIVLGVLLIFCGILPFCLASVDVTKLGRSHAGLVLFVFLLARRALLHQDSDHLGMTSLRSKMQCGTAVS